MLSNILHYQQTNDNKVFSASLINMEAELGAHKEFIAFMQSEYAKACSETVLVPESETESIRK